MGTRAARVKHWLLGDRPRDLLKLAAPTALAIVLDVALRARTMVDFAPQGKAIWLSSLLVSAAFWALPLWAMSRLRSVTGGRRRAVARALRAACFAGWVFPIAVFSYGGQLLYFRVFHLYMGRDTVRLGIALRGTLKDWLLAWQSPTVIGGMILAGATVTIAIFVVVEKAMAPATGRVPLLLVVTFAGAAVCFWTDNVDSRFLQAAVPDACFVHGAVHALRVSVTGQGRLHQGLSLRKPAALPPLTSARARPPNVLVILTESVRADAMCSRPPPACRAQFFDEVAPDRAPLGNLGTQTPSTFGAWVVLLTGLQPNADFETVHAAPVLWELARAVGYRTAYVSAQNMHYEDFGAFVQKADIDVLTTPRELGGVAQEHLGAPDERATAEALRVVREAPAGAPYFAILHLSNTHAPYRVDPALSPYAPHSDDPIGDAQAFHNHYRNSVLLQERTVTAFLRDLRALPSWDDTVVLFVSDHGEQFREHGGLYHNHNLNDEELRVPGWLIAGARALDDAQRAALASYGGARTFTQDIHATLVDLIGLHGAASALPFADRVGGRSLVRVRVPDPLFLLATSTAVWESDVPLFGAMQGDKKVIASPAGDFTCIDTLRHPSENMPFVGPECDALFEAVKRAYPALGAN